MTPEERIEAKENELMQIFAYLPADQLKVAGDLIRQAAFMAVMLEDLSATISENGATEEYNHGGGQCGTKVNSAVKAYNGAISKYTAIVTKLLNMIPTERINYQAKIDAIEREYAAKENQLQEKIADATRDGERASLELLAETMTKKALKNGDISRDEYDEHKDKIIREHAWILGFK